MRLAEVSSRLNDVAQRYQVPERVSAASQKLQEGLSCASDAASRSATAAYKLARSYPRTSIGSAIAAAALIGGVLWYLFHDRRSSAPKRTAARRVRAGPERRKRSHRAARAAAA